MTTLHDNEYDNLILLCIIKASISCLIVANESYQALIDQLEQIKRRAEYNHSCTPSTRKQWSDIFNKMPDILFRRMFRCSKESYNVLLEKIKEKIDVAVFKSEDWIITQKIYQTAVCGEVKLALTIRMLAGASYLDLLLIYEVSVKKLYEFFHECIGWINVTFSFRLVQYLQDENTFALTDISDGFSNRSDEIFCGCIGAIDGMAVRIKCPTFSKDDVRDPGNYYCRKGFYALNVQ